MRTGRCEDFAEAAAAMGERRAQLLELADSLGRRARRDRHASLEPLEGPADHRHAALPPERRDPPLRRLAQQQLRPARPRRRSAAPTARSPSERAAQLPARAARALRQLALRGGRLHAASTRPAREIFTRMFPRCGVPDAFAAGTSSSATCASSTRRGRSTSTRRSGGASARISPSRPSRSASATASRDLDEARSLAALMLFAHRAHRARDRRGRAAAGAAAPDDRGEPLARDPLRARRRADRPRDADACARRAPRSRS